MSAVTVRLWRRWMAVCLVLAAGVGLGIAHVESAGAFAALPSFIAAPLSGPVGTTYTIYVGWPAAVGTTGCPNPVDFAVFGPGDPQSGDYGPQIATGTLAANTFNLDGTLASYGTASVVPTQVGTYTVAIDPAGTSTLCDGSSIFAGSFAVTAATAPPDLLSLSPESQSQSLDNAAIVTATLVDGSTDQPVSGVGLTFGITGPNATAAGACVPTNCTTGSTGQVQFSYTASSTGHDTINVQVGPQGGSGAVAQAGVDWTPTVNGSSYAALGDSYSAGEGTGIYTAGTNTPGVNMCHRSSLAYGPLLDTRGAGLGSMAFVACSGGITDDLFSPNHSLNEAPGGSIEPAQLCQGTPVTVPGNATIAACGAGVLPALGPDTKTVTLTVGGNDAGFSSVVSACVWLSLSPFNLGQPGRGCSNTPSVYGPALRRVDALAGLGSASIDGRPIHSIASVLAAIHRVAPNAHVFIGGYPRLFQDATRRDCVVGTAVLNGRYGSYLEITPTDAAWLDNAAVLIDTAIAKAAARAGAWATYVDVTGRFAGHGLCTADSWITPINVTATINAGGEQFSSPPGDAHPTVAGQALGYEAAFAGAGA